MTLLELWKDLVEDRENTEVFRYCPDLALWRLVKLLWVSRLGPDDEDSMWHHVINYRTNITE